jgi:hypothetical protein
MPTLTPPGTTKPATADASANVVRRQPKAKSELTNLNFPIEQKPTLAMPPIDEPVEREPEIIVAMDPIEKSSMDALAMAEDPITLLIHRSVEKFSPPTTDYIAINGIPAEQLFRNGWVRMGYLPRGKSFITKRKYVEVLARAKQDAINTTVIERDNEDPQNFVERITTSTMSFTILKDDNKLGAAWLEQLVRSRS